MRARENPSKRKHCVTGAADSTDQRKDVGTVCASPQCELNGTLASADDLRALALLNYGHFTAMQISDGRVRGLDLHLARLDAGTQALFGRPLAADRIRGYMRTALGARAGDASMRVTVYSRDFDRDRPARPSQVDVLTTVGAARRVSSAPLRLKSFRHERVLPEIKHVGTFALFHYRRLAQLAGFDDALFACHDGAISEASVWNIGFFDGSAIVWPNAPALPGISMQLLQAGLREHGVAAVSRRVAVGDIAKYRSAFLTNSSCPVRPIASIDDVELAVDPELTRVLEACYVSNPLQAI